MAFRFRIKTICWDEERGGPEGGVPIPASAADLDCLEDGQVSVNPQRRRVRAVFPGEFPRRIVYAKEEGLTAAETVRALSRTWHRHQRDGIFAPQQRFVLCSMDPESGSMEVR